MIKVGILVISLLTIAGTLPIIIPDYDKMVFVPAILFVLLMIVYYGIVWIIFGYDKYKITTQISETMPTDISSEICHFWRYKGLSDVGEICAISLLEMIHNQFICIKKLPMYMYQIKRTGKPATTPIEELYATTTDVTETFGLWEISQKMNEFSARNYAFWKKMYHELYKPNNKIFLIGVYLFIGLIFLLRFPIGISFFGSILSVCTGLFIVNMNIRYVQNVGIKERQIRKAYMHVLIAMIVLIIYLPTCIIRSFAVLAVVFGLFPLFRCLLFQPTEIGAQKLSRIEGLKEFLDRMTPTDAQSLSAEEIRQLRLYAIALNKEQNWQKYCLPRLPIDERESEFYNDEFPVSFHTCFGRGYNQYQNLGDLSKKIVKFFTKRKVFDRR